MQHVRVAKYRLNSGDIKEISDLAQGGMLKVFMDQPGFISYGVADCGDGTFLSISHWDTHDEAEAAAGLAREWVATNIADRIELLENSTADYLFLG
jgi:heme-degrading monooxygenase HmoA